MSERRFALPLVPASFFGIVLGLAALASLWRVARALWGLHEQLIEPLTPR